MLTAPPPDAGRTGSDLAGLTPNAPPGEHAITGVTQRARGGGGGSDLAGCTPGLGWGDWGGSC